MHPFMRQINIISRCATMYRDRALRDTGLAGCHTPYILALYRIPGCTQEELARDLNVNKSSVARQLAVLEERGFIRREPSPEDRRSLLVFPTEKALSLQASDSITVRFDGQDYRIVKDQERYILVD